MALQLLSTAAGIDGEDKGIKAEMAKVKKLRDAAKAKERAAYSRMFA